MNIPQYITQLTKEWIKSVSKKLVQGNYIRIDETDDTRTVSIDLEGLSDFLGSGNGTVSSVDGHQPDENGAVSFGLTGPKWMKTDANGHIGTTEETPIAIDSSSVGLLYASGGAISYKGIGGNDGICGLDSNGKVEIGNLPTGSSSNQVALGNHGHNGMLTSTNFSGVLDSVYAKTSHRHDVSQINNLDLSQYLTNSDLSGYVKYSEIIKDSYNRYTTESNAKIQHAHDADKIIIAIVSGVSKTLDQYFTSDKIDPQKIKLKSNAGISADANGLGLTALAGSKWMKTDDNGYPSTTEETPVAVDSSQSGVLYNDEGELLYLDDLYDTDGNPDFVQKSSSAEQIVNGSLKTNGQLSSVGGGTAEGGQLVLHLGSSYRSYNQTFNVDTLNTTARFFFEGGSYGTMVMMDITRNSATSSTTTLYSGSVLRDAPAADTDYVGSQEVATMGWTNGKFIPQSWIGIDGGVATKGHTHDGYVTTDSSQTITGAKTFSGTITATANIQLASSAPSLILGNGSLSAYSNLNFQSSTGSLNIDNSSRKIVLASSTANNVELLTAPTVDTSSTDSKAVATCGWTASKFAPKTVSDPVTEDKVLMIEQGGTTASWQSAGLTPSAPADYSVLSADTGSDSAYGGPDPSNINWSYNGYDGLCLWVTTRVRWNGTELKEFRRLLTFSTNGLLYSVGQETSHLIETPTEIRWS